MSDRREKRQAFIDKLYKWILSVVVILGGFFLVFMSPCAPSSVLYYLLFLIAGMLLMPLPKKIIDRFSFLSNYQLRSVGTVVFIIVGLITSFMNCSDIGIDITEKPPDKVSEATVVIEGRIRGYRPRLWDYGTEIEIQDGSFTYIKTLKPGYNTVSLELIASPGPLSLSSRLEKEDILIIYVEPKSQSRDEADTETAVAARTVEQRKTESVEPSEREDRQESGEDDSSG